MASLGIRPDAGAYPGFVGLGGRDVRTGGPPASFSTQPPANPGLLTGAPGNIPRRQYPIPGTTTQPTVNGSTTLTRIVQPENQDDLDKLNCMVEGDLVFIRQPNAYLTTSTGEDIADICTLDYLNKQLAKPEYFLNDDDFVVEDYINRGDMVQPIVSATGPNRQAYIDLNEKSLQKRNPNHPLAVYVLDGIARVVDPEATNFYGEMRTSLVYNVVAQGCCTVNNSTQKFTRPDGDIQLVSEQIFDTKPEMNSILYLALTITKESSGWRAEYKCISNANLRRTAIVWQQDVDNPSLLTKQQVDILKQRLNQQPRLANAKIEPGHHNGYGGLHEKASFVTTEKSNTYTETLKIIATTIRLWRVGRIIDARAQPMSTSVLTSFSPAVEVDVEIYRVVLAAFGDVSLNNMYLPFQSTRRMLKPLQKSALNQLKIKKNIQDRSAKRLAEGRGLYKPMQIGCGYDDDADDPLDVDMIPTDTTPITTPTPIAEDAFNPAVVQAFVDIQKAWITLLQTAIPSMARPQFDAMVAEYSQKADALSKSKDVDDLKQSYEHLCARARDSIEGSTQSAKLNSARLKQTTEQKEMPNLHTVAIKDVHMMLDKAIVELERMTKLPVHKDAKDHQPNDQQRLDMSSFCEVNMRTNELIDAVHSLNCCNDQEFKSQYRQICDALKLKELPLVEDTTYATTNASTTYASTYAAPASGSSSNASDDDGFLRVDTGSEKPRKRTPPRASGKEK